MLARRRIAPGVSTTLLIALAAAIVPGARWCTLRWDQVDTQAFLACQAASHLSMASCAMVRALVEHPGRVKCNAAGDSRGACAAATSCPMRSNASCSNRACESAPMPGPGPRSHGRAYCLDEPGMATGVRAAAPGLDHALVHAAILATFAMLPPAPAIEHLVPVAEARPPTPTLSARPPIRGPPRLLDPVA